MTVTITPNQGDPGVFTIKIDEERTGIRIKNNLGRIISDFSPLDYVNGLWQSEVSLQDEGTFTAVPYNDTEETPVSFTNPAS